MYIFLIIVHVFVCLVLIAVILLQAGRGGGMSDVMAGGQAQSLFGTQTNTFMTRATEVCAVVFVITSLSLGIITTHRGKSLMEKEMLASPAKSAVTVPAAKAATTQDVAQDLVKKAVDLAAVEAPKATENNVTQTTEVVKEAAQDVQKAAETASH